MDSVGVGQKYCNEIIGKVHKIGNNFGLPEPALADTLEGLEEDVKDEEIVDSKDDDNDLNILFEGNTNKFNTIKKLLILIK